MKLIKPLLLATCVALAGCDGSIQSQDVFKAIDNVANEMNAASGSGGITNDQVVAGLKEALNRGTSSGSSKLTALDGFFKDAAIKILIPPEAKNVETKLRAIGLNDLCDKAILAINRGAENAAGQAAPIFSNAIRQMSFSDAMGILKGGGTGATDYLKRTCTAQLTTAFRPVIENSLKSTDATKYWGDAMSAYNQIPLVTPINTDLTGYVTSKAIDGLFLKIAEEETNIRTNPAARVTALLQKVFGSVK
ncbi:MAG: hypothetical protein RJA07_1468 [Bacteroidota bacterium]|jgi:hypothetical protein